MAMPRPGYGQAFSSADRREFGGPQFNDVTRDTFANQGTTPDGYARMGDIQQVSGPESLRQNNPYISYNAYGNRIDGPARIYFDLINARSLNQPDWMVQRVLPREFNRDGMDSKVDVEYWPVQIMRAVAERVQPRMLVSTSASVPFTMMRYAIGTITNDAFSQTARGQHVREQMAITIGASIILTEQYNGVLALLAVPTNALLFHLQRTGGTRLAGNRLTAKELKENVAMFGLFAKSITPVQDIISLVSTYMAAFAEKPNALIVPAGIAEYLELHNIKTPYSMKCPHDAGTITFTESTWSTRGGTVNVYEASPYPTASGVSENVLSRVVAVGNYNVMTPRGALNKDGVFETSGMTIRIPVGDSDSFKEVTLGSVIDNMPNFARDTNAASGSGYSKDYDGLHLRMYGNLAVAAKATTKLIDPFIGVGGKDASGVLAAPRLGLRAFWGVQAAVEGLNKTVTEKRAAYILNPAELPAYEAARTARDAYFKLAGDLGVEAALQGLDAGDRNTAAAAEDAGVYNTRAGADTDTQILEFIGELREDVLRQEDVDVAVTSILASRPASRILRLDADVISLLRHVPAEALGRIVERILWGGAYTVVDLTAALPATVAAARQAERTAADAALVHGTRAATGVGIGIGTRFAGGAAFGATAHTAEGGAAAAELPYTRLFGGAEAGDAAPATASIGARVGTGAVLAGIDTQIADEHVYANAYMARIMAVVAKLRDYARTEVESDHAGMFRLYAELWYYSQPLRLSSFKKLAALNIPLPVAAVLVRRRQRFRMMSVIAVKEGFQTGISMMSLMQVNQGSNPGTQSSLYTASVYLASIVKRPRNVQVIPDAVFDGYIAGRGVTFVTPTYKAASVSAEKEDAVPDSIEVLVTTIPDAESIQDVLVLSRSSNQCGVPQSMCTNPRSRLYARPDQDALPGVAVFRMAYGDGTVTGEPLDALRAQWKPRRHGVAEVLFKDAQERLSLHTRAFVPQWDNLGHLGSQRGEFSSAYTGSMLLPRMRSATASLQIAN